MSFYTDIVLAGFANIDSSETLKEQYERYCDWCWGHGYGDCRYCIRKYHKLYIPLRIAEKQKELGLEITRGLEMVSSKDKHQYDESTNRVNKLPELTNYIDQLRRVSFTSICEHFCIWEDELDEILVQESEYFNIRQKDNEVQVSLSPSGRKYNKYSHFK